MDRKASTIHTSIISAFSETKCSGMLFRPLQIEPQKWRDGLFEKCFRRNGKADTSRLDTGVMPIGTILSKQVWLEADTVCSGGAAAILSMGYPADHTGWGKWFLKDDGEVASFNRRRLAKGDGKIGKGDCPRTRKKMGNAIL